MSEAEIAAWEALGRAQAYIDQLQALPKRQPTPKPTPKPLRRWEVVIVAARQRRVETVAAEAFYEVDGALRFMRRGGFGRADIYALYAPGEWRSVREL